MKKSQEAWSTARYPSAAVIGSEYRASWPRGLSLVRCGFLKSGAGRGIRTHTVTGLSRFPLPLEYAREFGGPPGIRTRT